MRRLARGIERSWSGAEGTHAWTRVLEPLAAGYRALSAVARSRAARRRRPAPLYVLAVGNITVGGVGKSSVARWLAAQAVAGGGRAAILLRGHGSARTGCRPAVVPDFDGMDLAARAERYGDDAVAHRRALPASVAIVVDPDRARAARVAAGGYAASAAVLDDGWEQAGLVWNELWVVIDPRAPAGNGALLPAGPLRRPASTLREATRIVTVLEASDEAVSDRASRWAARHAPGHPILRFRRVLRSLSPPWAPAPSEAPRPGERVALVSGIGAPERLERFATDAGFRLVEHAAFPNHARWSPAALRGALEEGQRAGAALALITEKDEARWPASLEAPLPVRVLRTALVPLDPVEDALAGLRGAVAGARPIG